MKALADPAQVKNLVAGLEQDWGPVDALVNNDATTDPGWLVPLVDALDALVATGAIVNLPAVLIVPASIRPLLARFLRRTVSQLKVLAHSEIPDNRLIKVTSIIGGNRP